MAPESDSPPPSAHQDAQVHERTPLLSSEESQGTLIDSHLRDDNSLDATESLLDQKPHSWTDTSTWKTESWLLLSYSAPLVGTYLLQYFYSVVTIFVAGHIGSDALAAASIGVTTMTIIGYAIFEGMATALDTLCAQAYGSGNLHGVGLHVQRMVLLMGVAAVPIGTFWICSPWVLALVVKQEYLAHMAGRFLQVSLIGLPGYAIFEAAKRFVQAQGQFTSSLVVLIICAPVNVILNWLFCFKLGWGLAGTALAAALTNNLRPILLVLYVCVFRRWTLECWDGFSWKAWHDWGPMIQLSTAGTILNISEWFAFEIMTFSSSYISTKHIAAQTILTTTSVLVWHIPFSVSVAVSTRVGHLIGSGAIKNAKRVITFYAVVFVCIGVFDGLLLFLLRHHIPQFFSEDPEVQAIAAQTTPVVALFQLTDAIIAGSCGCLRGFGRQSVAAWAAFLVNYLAAVPIGLWLELGSSGLQLVGCWSALQGGMVIIAAIEIGTMKMMSWQKCVEDAQLRS
ncbi:hypothetical protein PMZ80_005872 [Knufia obscura]|uniref:MATE efflux family protein n=2 Tax=Knufia TaxID=430999 RepID=A0AAN8EFJ5_9EURO|nr:hypothetical protein PMZ80_005872 [Knufia obscura]KAK5954539.1 hypothetical protein OHC33_004261 [Knufia fluminis]